MVLKCIIDFTLIPLSVINFEATQASSIFWRVSFSEILFSFYTPSCAEIVDLEQYKQYFFLENAWTYARAWPWARDGAWHVGATKRYNYLWQPRFQLSRCTAWIVFSGQFDLPSFFKQVQCLTGSLPSHSFLTFLLTWRNAVNPRGSNADLPTSPLTKVGDVV